MRRLGLLVLALAAGLCGATAQTTVKLTLTDNSAQRYVFSADGGVYFADGVLTVKQDAGTEVGAVALSEVQRMVFRAGDVGMDNAGSQQHVRVFPNPVSEDFTVSGVGTEGYEAVVYTMMGQVVLRQRCMEGSRVNISHLQRGVYVVRIGETALKVVKR